MKISKIVFLSLLLLSFTCVSDSVLAQKGKKKPAAGSSNKDPFGGSASGGSKDPFGGSASQPPKTSGGTSSSSSSGQKDPFASGNSGGDPFKSSGGSQPPQGKPSGGFNKNLPISFQKMAGGDPLTDTIKPYLRNPSSITSATKDRIPLEWDYIREDDATYRHKIWEIVDAREKINHPYVYKEDEGKNLFFTILVRAILEDTVMAFEHYDFRKEVTKKEIKTKCTGGVDTVYTYGLDGEINGLSVGKKEFPIDSVYQFQIMEEIFFDKESSKLLRRIIGIAPMGPLVVNGKTIPGQNFPYFWVYYPDLRKTLAKKQVYNPKNLNSNQTWEDYLEAHQYSYYVIKTSMDNVKDQKYSEYITDPLFRLFEGEKLKNQIFSYEQSLWAY